jgi:hypothetical protein
MGRYYRQGLMSHALIHQADLGWRNDWIDVPGAAADYVHRLPKVKLVADGRPCSEHARQGHTSRMDPVCMLCSLCFSTKGRGTTLFDLCRQTVRHGSILSYEWLSLKSASVGADGKLPSWLGLTTGNFSTLLRIEKALAAGTPLPTLVWASAKDAEVGYALALDLAVIIREHGVTPITEYPGKWARGKAPPAWHRWGSWQGSGQKKTEVLAALGMEIPTGSVWTGEAEWAAGKVRYPQLTVGISRKALANLGVSWYQQVHVSELAAFAETHLDWASL